MMDITEPLQHGATGMKDSKMSAAISPGSTHPDPHPAAVTSPQPHHTALRWLWHDWPYITLLILALAGLIFRLPLSYWIILTPVFAVISIATGWRHFATSTERLELVYRLVLSWSALLLAIYLLFSNGVLGVLNANANSLSMLTLLAVGTFITGVEAREWRICAVGGVFFLAVPGLGWLDQSPLLLGAATVAVIALGGLAWWVSKRRTASTAAAS